MQVERASAPTSQNGCDLSGRVSADNAENDVVFPPSGTVSVVPGRVNRPSTTPDNAVASVEPAVQNFAYSDIVRGPENRGEPLAYVPDPDNELPTRPLTVFFNPRSRIPAHEVFQALRTSGTDNSSVSCIQRQSSGEIVSTFRNSRAKEQFLSHNVV